MTNLEFLEKSGYSIQESHQPWRHIVATLRKDGKLFHLKMATNSEISVMTQNEVVWNNLINNFPKQTFPFLAPKIVQTGISNQQFWFISENIEGKELSLTNENLDFIVKSAISILNMPQDNFLPKDKNDATTAEGFLAKIEKFRTKTTVDTSNLAEFIKTNLNYVLFAPCHGDFVNRHFLKSDKGIYLIDSEHSRIKGIKFYDVAYFYHRVYTKRQKPDIAKSFLKKFKANYQMSESDQKCFNLVLAGRLIGGYMDAESDNATSKELSKQLEDELLNGTS